MSISQYGQSTPNLPGLYVQIVPPRQNFLSPAETDILGAVGTAVWGPVNAPTNVGGLPDYVTKFGNPAARKYDMGTFVWAANQQGAQNFRCVRVTDGTDTAASGALGITGTAVIGVGGSGNAVNDVLTLNNGATIKVLTVTGGAVATFQVLTQPTSQPANPATVVSTTGAGTGATFTFTYTVGATAASKYTGSGANGDTIGLAAGSASGTWKVTVFHPGLPTEIFDNIGAGLSANALWAAIVSAVNNGNAVRGPSQLMVLTLGTQTAAPTASTSTLAGGTDGVTSVTGTSLVGADTTPRTGMYALRKTGASVAALVDCDASATWPSQVSFGLSEGIYMIGTGPAGDTISNAISTKASAGVDSYAFKLLFGDWVYFLDTINGQTRLISPQGFVAGEIAANGPQFSALNQQLYGIVGTQKSNSNLVYYDDDLVSLNAAGIDVITNPSPGGAYFSCRMGHNSSSNPLVRGDNYTRMTNFIAASINAGLGGFIGQLQLPEVQKDAKATLDAYFDDLWTNKAIGTPDPTVVPWLVTLDGTNNPQSAVAAGRMQADVKVIYASVIEKLLVNIEGGQSVQITRVSTTSAV